MGRCRLALRFAPESSPFRQWPATRRQSLSRLGPFLAAVFCQMPRPKNLSSIPSLALQSVPSWPESFVPSHPFAFSGDHNILIMTSLQEDTLPQIPAGLASNSMPRVQIPGYLCERCAHKWVPRGEPSKEPVVCPKCKSPYWDTPRKSKANRQKSAQ